MFRAAGSCRVVSGPLLPGLAELAPVGTSASSTRPCRQPEQDGMAPLTTQPPPARFSLAPRSCCGPEDRCRLRTSCGAAPTALFLPMTGRGFPGAPDLLPGLTGRGGPPGRHPGPAVGTPGPLTLVTMSPDPGFLSLISWPLCSTCGISLPRPGIEPLPPAVEAQSLNHWTTKEALDIGCFTFK